MNNLVHEYVKKKSVSLNNYGFSNAYKEIFWYLEHLELVSKSNLYFNNMDLDIELIKNKVDYFFEKRKSNIPFQHILGLANFYGRDFYIDSNVLIPRQDSELFFEILKGYNFNKALDIGVGSGNLAITLSLEKIAEHIDAIDISKSAIQISSYNIKQYNIKNFNVFICDILKENLQERYNLIISNPPYISLKEYKNLPDEIVKNEPKKALTDSYNGMLFYERYAEILKDILAPNGIMLCEFGVCTPAKKISQIFNKKGFSTTIYKDLQANDRMIKISYD